jgi:hypothetical protein
MLASLNAGLAPEEEERVRAVGEAAAKRFCPLNTTAGGPE